jgi:acyl-CoA dehydrogenase
LSGQKVFISNGQLADVFIVAARIDGSEGLSLFIVDASSSGVTRGRNLEKLGNHAQDTSELFFDHVSLLPGSLLGEEGQGFECLMHGLARERLTICVGCQARAEAVLRDTVAYVAERQVFGSPLAQWQNTRFVLGAVKAELIAGRALVDRCLPAVARRLGLHERVRHLAGLCRCACRTHRRGQLRGDEGDRRAHALAAAAT